MQTYATVRAYLIGIAEDDDISLRAAAREAMDTHYDVDVRRIAADIYEMESEDDQLEQLWEDPLGW